MLRRLFISIAVCSATLLSAQDCDKRENRTVPAGVRFYIKKEFPGYRFAEGKDFLDTWCMNYRDTEVPWYAQGDFNGDKHDDHVVMLIHEDKIFLVVLSGGYRDGFHHTLLKPREGGTDYYGLFYPPLNFGLGKAPPGTSYDFGTREELFIATTSISVRYWEKAASSFYWDNGKYVEIYSGD